VKDIDDIKEHKAAAALPMKYKRMEFNAELQKTSHRADRIPPTTDSQDRRYGSQVD